MSDSSPCGSPSSSSSSGGSGGGGGGGVSSSEVKGSPIKPCNCPTTLVTESTRYSQCPVCLSKFDLKKLPIALNCSHTICIHCAVLLVPGVEHNIELFGVINYPLLVFLDYPVDNCAPVLEKLCMIARLIRSHTVSRSIHRKTIILINSVTSNDYSKLLKPIKNLGERCVVELTSVCSHASHYHAQQQLWAAIRARACQFMGPAMQDEALKLVLLALEDGSALSRKVLVMFVVQRLAPQFPQASKTSVGHIVQLLYRASAFDVQKRPGNSSLMTLRPEFRNYEALRREHDTQIMKIGLDAGIRFTPEQWSSLLYGDTSQKPLMQSIIDKLQSPQTFEEQLKEYLVSVQRLSTPDSQFLVSLHPHFKLLANINTETVGPIESYLDSLHAVLLGLISFTANRKHQRNSRPNGGGNGGGATTTVFKPSYVKSVKPDDNICGTSSAPPADNNNIVHALQSSLCIN
ncbi:unnamed protein product [Orchesella dallaii]|uniref:RING-type E3 ubiquitin transferase n=1 Tax=Orchesella dallaii TaxID=48710 RepID=A0ABP1QU29_9HEXA